jgi:hypothetical protein
MDGGSTHRKASTYTEQHKIQNKCGYTATPRVEFEQSNTVRSLDGAATVIGVFLLFLFRIHQISTVSQIIIARTTSTSYVFCFVEMHHKNPLLWLSCSSAHYAHLDSY